MGKYVIESKFENTRCFLEVACENREPYFFINSVDSLTPYTEPDMEQVRKEAYENGYENGFVAGHLKAEKSGQSFYEDGYKRGLADAWEAARKVTQVRKYGGYGDCLGDVFGRTDTSWDVFDYSAPEAIEKIRQYEQEKEEQDGLRQNIQTIVDQCGYSLDEIATVLQKMKES